MNKTRRLIGGVVIAAALSGGGVGMTLAAGTASANGLSDRPCVQFCKNVHNKWIPVLQGPGYNRPFG